MSTPKKHTYPELLWAGTDHSLTLAIEANDAMMAGVYDAPKAGTEQEVPYVFSQQGSVGVVSIKGSLTNRDSAYNEYYGVTSYSDISKAMIHAAEEPSVQAIVLDIDSGGGAVSGVADTSRLISSIAKGVKPVYTFAGGTMASAAYWLGASAGPGNVFVSDTSISGSIGVITTHTEYSKAMKEAGIGVTVMRAGEYKALANSAEPLTDNAKRQLQDQLNSAYGVFINHVAESRGTTVNLADQKMGQGREFFGADAVTAGLVDGVTSFDALIGSIEKKILDRASQYGNVSSNLQRGNTMTRKALTEQAIAAMAAGGVMPVAEVVVEPTATIESPTETIAAAAPVTLAVEVTETKIEKDDSAVVVYLQGQVKATTDEVVELKIALAAANETVKGMKASHDALVKIAAQSVSHMKVAMGLTNIDLSGMKAETLLAEHSATAGAFTKAFKVGGVAAVSTSEALNEDKIDPLFAARVAANRYPNRK